jgi:hypothetical protein
MTKQRQRERKRRRQAEARKAISGGPWRAEAEAVRLQIMFGHKKHYSNREIEEVRKQLAKDQAKDQRLDEVTNARLAVKFGHKEDYSDWEYDALNEELAQAGLDHEAMEDPDAVEAVYKKLAEAEEKRRAIPAAEPSTVS